MLRNLPLPDVILRWSALAKTYFLAEPRKAHARGTEIAKRPHAARSRCGDCTTSRAKRGGRVRDAAVELPEVVQARSGRFTMMGR